MLTMTIAQTYQHRSNLRKSSDQIFQQLNYAAIVRLQQCNSDIYIAISVASLLLADLAPGHSIPEASSGSQTRFQHCEQSS